MRIQIILALMSGLLLAACGDDGAPTRSAEEMAQLGEIASTLRPNDARLAEVYERSCANCHGIVESGAPLTGDATGWSNRLAKGNDVLLESTISGFGGMPPMGLCPDCTAREFEALIAFMSAAQN